MSTSRALFLKEKFGAFEVGVKTRPTPGPGEVLVKEKAVALNPIDWKIHTYGVLVSEFPAILGSDAAGEVEAVGDGVTQFQKGDRVLHQGALQAGGHYSTFQEYVLAPAEIVVKIPANITFNQAATLPLGVATAVIPLYSPPSIGIGLQAPWDGGQGKYTGQAVVILGGASSVGQYAIQFARLSGFSPIITTASLRNTELLRSLGATHIIDRNTPSSSVVSEIASITTNPITVVYDAVAQADTAQLGYDILTEGGHVVVVLESSIKQVPGSTKKVLSVLGNVQLPANREIGRALAQGLPALLEAGDFIPNRVEVLSGGLRAISAGLDKLKNNLVSGKKLVVNPDETA